MRSLVQGREKGGRALIAVKLKNFKHAIHRRERVLEIKLALMKDGQEGLKAEWPEEILRSRQCRQQRCLEWHLDLGWGPAHRIHRGGAEQEFVR